MIELTAAETAALEMRRKGMRYADIAKEQGVGTTTAWERVQRGLVEAGKIRLQEADLLLDLEMERLDHLLMSLQGEIAAGNPKAVMAALGIMDRRSRYLGLDKPQKIEMMTMDQADEIIRGATGEE